MSSAIRNLRKVRLNSTYWVRWLGWAWTFPCFVYATSVHDGGGDTGDDEVPVLFCVGHETNCYSIKVSSTHATTVNYAHQTSTTPFDAILPDTDPSGATYPASFGSFAIYTDAVSVPPIIQSPSPCGTVNTLLYRTTIALTEGQSCFITVAPQNNGAPLEHIFYSGTLSRTGNIYYLSGGNICGAPYSDCPVLTTTTAGAGSGTVTDNSPHQNGRFAINAQVELTATPAFGSVFAGWSGDAGCANSFNIGNANKTCTATFNISPIPASLLNFNQPPVIFSKEIKVTE